MQDHEPEVTQYFSNLAYLLKEADKNGIEVMLTSEDKPYRAATTAELVSHVSRTFHRGKFGVCPMEECLNKLVAQLIPEFPDRLTSTRRLSILRRKEKSPASIYILTNGAWACNHDAHLLLKRPINDLVETIESRRLERTYVVLQFIRFGDGPGVTERLDELDNFLDKTR